MLGRFLEYSIATPDIRASLEFYARLGFSQAVVGEAWRHLYAVVTDGRIHLGLHQDSTQASSITFVKPELLKHLAALEGAGVNFEFCRLDNDVFNELGWFDPSEHLVRLLEARTFSPTKRGDTDTSACGYFLEIGLPAPNIGASKDFWEKLGFVGMDEPAAALPHVSCTSDSINIGLYEPAHLRTPALVFDAGDVGAALARLAAAGIEPAFPIPAPLRQRGVAVLVAPEGTSILLLPEPEP